MSFSFVQFRLLVNTVAVDDATATDVNVPDTYCTICNILVKSFYTRVEIAAVSVENFVIGENQLNR